jgi:ubiquinone/menaquinone biosynthesis C-methylase UbiE
LNVKPGYKVLEIGMANGYFVKDLLSLSDGIDYTGCDYSELMVSEAVKMNREFIDKGIVRFVCAPAEEMPFPEKEFDRIYAVNTVYFWDNLSAAVSELYRVLKPGGQAVIGYRPQRHIKKGPFTKYGFNAYSDEYIKKTFEENKFTIISQNDVPDEAVDSGRKFLTSVTVLIAERP